MQGQKVLDAMQKAGLGQKEPHVHDQILKNFKRPSPSYKKDKFEGRLTRMAMLSEKNIVLACLVVNS